MCRSSNYPVSYLLESTIFRRRGDIEVRKIALTLVPSTLVHCYNSASENDFIMAHSICFFFFIFQQWLKCSAKLSHRPLSITVLTLSPNETWNYSNNVILRSRVYLGLEWIALITIWPRPNWIVQFLNETKDEPNQTHIVPNANFDSAPLYIRIAYLHIVMDLIRTKVSKVR